MLQISLLFSHTADAKNYNGELELRSMKTSLFTWDLDTVAVICTLICILGLIGNTVILWLLCCTIRTTKFTVYFANLAVVDILVLLRTFITFVEYLAKINMSHRIRHLIIIIFFFGHESNSLFFTAISTERCLTVFSPVWYQSHRRKYSTAIVCAILWTLSVMLSMLDHFLCTTQYIATFNIGSFPCKVATKFQDVITGVIFIPITVLSTLALFIRMKRKPQQNLPARLDISILATVVLHLFFYITTEMVVSVYYFFSTTFPLEYYLLTLVFYCMTSSVNPVVFLLVGCWKRREAQGPFYMFLERALKDERKDSMSTQADQEQA